LPKLQKALLLRNINQLTRDELLGSVPGNPKMVLTPIILNPRAHTGRDFAPTNHQIAQICFNPRTQTGCDLDFSFYLCLPLTQQPIKIIYQHIVINTNNEACHFILK
jgi:hypothetical protein